MSTLRNIITFIILLGIIFFITTHLACTIFIYSYYKVNRFYPIDPNLIYNYFIVPVKYIITEPQYLTNSEFYKANNGLYKKLITSILITYVPVILLLTFKLKKLYKWQSLKSKEKNVHGTSHWATDREKEKAGLRDKDGLIIGKDLQGDLRANGGHILLYAPTGSGKGVGIVIPNLLTYQESIIIHDIKGENYELTSGYRSTSLKQKVFCFCPIAPDRRTHCYNPLDFISHKYQEMVKDVQTICATIVPEDPKQQDKFWVYEARALLAGVILYLSSVADRARTFGEVLRILKSDDVVYHFSVMLDTVGRNVHPVACLNLGAFISKPDKERSGVLSTLVSNLDIFSNPFIDTATSRSDFNFHNFKREKTTLYSIIPPSDIARLSPLMSAIYQQATQIMTRKMPDPEKEPYTVTFLLDEFPTLGKMEQFELGIAYFRGYHVRLLLIVQDTEQLKSIYQETGMNAFMANAKYRITYSANNIQTAEYVSKSCGNKTVKKFSQNRSMFLDFNPASRSTHESNAQRALILPQEVMQLDYRKEIILIEASPPILANKIFYYKDRKYTRRLLKPSSIPEQALVDPSLFNLEERLAIQNSFDE